MGGRELYSATYDKVSVLKLSLPQRHLLREARRARERAYAPYSGFSVGAAVAFSDGRVVTGNNQENAAYPSGLCAERVALFAARASHPDALITRMAVVGANRGHGLFPCGACRQVMFEYEQRQQAPFEVLLHDLDSRWVYVFQGMNLLLPFGFSFQPSSQ